MQIYYLREREETKAVTYNLHGPLLPAAIIPLIQNAAIKEIQSVLRRVTDLLTGLGSPRQKRKGWNVFHGWQHAERRQPSHVRFHTIDDCSA